MASAAALAKWISFMAVLFVLQAVSSSGSRDVGVLRNLPAGRWCIAQPVASAAVLQEDIDEICRQLDCGVIKPGGACYDPNTLESHATVALNLYYKSHGSQQSACAFPGAMISLDNPSFGNCKFP